MGKIAAVSLGWAIPKFKTFDQWLEIYTKILVTKPIKQKTIENRKNSCRHLRLEFGERSIGTIRPHEIAQFVRGVHQVHPHLARRILIEAKDCWYEAMNYGWIDRNPAASVKHTRTRVSRRRLSFENWERMYEYSTQNMSPWVSRLLLLAVITGQRRADLHKLNFSDVMDDYLTIIQQKTGTKLRLPLSLRLDCIGVSLKEAIDSCVDYAPIGDGYLLRKGTGDRPCIAHLSARFETCRELTFGIWTGEGTPFSLHECRSLSERLYRKQGIDTKTLLGHKHQSMTDAYNDDRGLEAEDWKTLVV